MQDHSCRVAFQHAIPIKNTHINSRSTRVSVRFAKNGDEKAGSRHFVGKKRLLQSRADTPPRTDPLPGPSVIQQPAPKSLPPESVAVVWLRNDLRIRDHAAFALANTAATVVPVYVFDTSKFGRKNASPWGFQRSGPFRTVFLIESVKELRNSLRIHGSDMIVRRGNPVEEVLDVVKTLATEGLGPINVIAHKETTWEEETDEKALQNGLRELAAKINEEISVHWVWGRTLYHFDDLPFIPNGRKLPDTFTAYRDLLEGPDCPAVRSELGTLDQFSSFPLHLQMRSDPFPSLRNDLKVEGLCDPHDYAYPHPLGIHEFQGGHTAGEERIQEYIWKSKSLQYYKETRNDSGKRNSSSKFSPWISLGCISPRAVYWECKKFEDRFDAGESTQSILHEMIARDYFHWIAASVGRKLFALNGYPGLNSNEKGIWTVDPSVVTEKHRERLEKWIQGQTGAPIVDAHMRELSATGYMSNRGRQIVASFLIHNLQFPDWRAGAEYFESVLIDYDAAVNWGNWAYLAGIGNDPHGGRKLNVVKQSMQYDKEGWFVKRWCPELQDVPPPMVHEPHTLSKYELEDFGVQEDVTYPRPIVELDTASPTRV